MKNNLLKYIKKMALFDIDNWKEIGASLSRNKTRTFLTAFGIFWGTLMLSLLWGAGQGVRRLMYSNFEGFASNSAIIFPNRTTLPYKGFKKGLWWSFTTTDVTNLRRRIPELEVVTPYLSRYSNVRYKNKSNDANVVGVEPEYAKVLNPIITKGRFINEIDLNQNAKVCLIGESLAEQLFPGQDPLGKMVDVNNVHYRVIGVCKQSSEVQIGGRLDRMVVMPITTARIAYNYGNRCGMIMIVVKDGVRPSELKDKLFQTFRMSHPIHPDDSEAVQYFDASEMFDQISKLFGGLDFLILFVGFSSLLAGVIGVGNIMWVIVKERTKEFGIRRALGAKPRKIMGQILSESAVLTVIAGMAATTLSVLILGGATYILRQSMEGTLRPDQINFQLSFVHAFVILLLFLILGSLAGVVPAIKAMRIKPIEALNDK